MKFLALYFLRVGNFKGAFFKDERSLGGGLPNVVTINNSDVIVLSNNDVILRSEGERGSKKA